MKDEDLALPSCEFTTSKGRTYKVIGTERTGKAMIHTVDTIKNPEGKIKKMKRLETIKLMHS